MNKKISLGATIGLLVITVALTICVTMFVAMRQFNAAVSDLSKRQAQYSYLNDVDRAIRQNYYGTIDETKLQQALAGGYVKGLDDPYAESLTPEEFKKAQEVLGGQTTGYGFDVELAGINEIVVSWVDKDSPAEKAGVTKGAVLTMIDGKLTSSMSFKTVQNKLNNPSKAIFTLKQNGTTKAFELSAGAIDIGTVEGKMIDTIGYVRIRSFNNDTPAEFKKVMAALTDKDATAFIFDLRDNAGGSLKGAQEVIGQLLPGGTYANLKDGKGTLTHMTADSTLQLQKKSVTLINAGTQGEAELFAAVLHDFEKTTLVGMKTYGRGVTQEYFQNSQDGSGIKITTGEFQLLKGESWDKAGIEPDVEQSLTGGSTIIDVLDPQKDSQLTAAKEYLATGSTGFDSATSAGEKDGETTGSTASSTTAATTTTAKAASTTSK